MSVSTYYNDVSHQKFKENLSKFSDVYGPITLYSFTSINTSDLKWKAVTQDAVSNIQLWYDMGWSPH